MYGIAIPNPQEELRLRLEAHEELIEAYEQLASKHQHAAADKVRVRVTKPELQWSVCMAVCLLIVWPVEQERAVAEVRAELDAANQTIVDLRHVLERVVIGSTRAERHIRSRWLSGKELLQVCQNVPTPAEASVRTSRAAFPPWSCLSQRRYGIALCTEIMYAERSTRLLLVRMRRSRRRTNWRDALASLRRNAVSFFPRRLFIRSSKPKLFVSSV
jgi:hypothetical protein